MNRNEEERMEIELNKVYKTLPPEWVEFLKRPRRIKYLPTEMVVSEPRMVIPDERREYILERWVVGGKVVAYRDLSVVPNFRGTSRYAQIVMSEVYEDWGSDGHVDNRLVGWEFKTL